MRVKYLVPLALALAACGHPVTPVQRPVAAPVAAVAQRMSPEDALKKANDKAAKWNADARLVGVAWGVAKLELASVVYHLYFSPKADKLFEVQSKLVSFWQDTKEITDPHFCKPARYLDTLGVYQVTAHQALATAKTFLPDGNQHPIALLVEAKPTRFLPAMWGCKADQLKILIDAQNGKVLAHTTRDLPPLPFGEDSPF
ncbi:MAG: hypothetical protein JWM80_3218 [Cyanobacteria bacterium RYN_339]|nr:hypothetical protein [Cyanobacteria bacterium RYN_339]